MWYLKWAGSGKFFLSFLENKRNHIHSKIEFIIFGLEMWNFNKFEIFKIHFVNNYFYAGVCKCIFDMVVVAHGVSRQTPPGCESRCESQDHIHTYTYKHTHTHRETHTNVNSQPPDKIGSDYGPGNWAALKPPIIIAAGWLAGWLSDSKVTLIAERLVWSVWAKM